MPRVMLSVILGAAVTFALFVFMAFLVGDGTTNVAVRNDSPVIEITMNKNDAQYREKPLVKPTPPTPPKKPTLSQKGASNNSVDIDKNISFNMGDVVVSSAIPELKPGDMMTRDGDATPIVRIEPQYPIAAVRRGKEGYVQLSFTINRLGGVEDIDIIAAKPKRIFNSAAKRAIRKWKYKPKIVDGKAVKQMGIKVQLEFKLTGDEK